MGANVETEIAVALHTHLEALADVWPVAYENVEFTAPADGQYLRVQNIPGRNTTLTTDDNTFYFFGIYQVSVITLAGVGSIVAVQEASRTARHFAYLTEITCPSGIIMINRQPQVIGGLSGENTYEVPININYHIFTD